MMRKYGFRTLGLAFIAALSLVAFSASAAQAALIELGDWLVNGANLIPAGTEVTATGVVDVEPVLLVLALNVEIKCKKVLVTEGKLFPLEQITEGTNVRDVSLGRGSFVFEECEFVEDSTGNHMAACQIEKDSEAGMFNEQRIILASALFKVERHAGSAYVLASPIPPATEFANIKVEGCSLPLNNRIKGTLLIDFKEAGNRVTQLILPSANQALLSDGLLDGANPAVFTGAVNVSLTGANAGQTWGIC